jgi:hypothetical protein
VLLLDEVLAGRIANTGVGRIAPTLTGVID